MLFEDFAIADGLLAGREFFFDHFTAPDAYFFWCFRRALSFNLDLSKFAHCAAHFEHIKQRAERAEGSRPRKTGAGRVRKGGVR